MKQEEEVALPKAKTKEQAMRCWLHFRCQFQLPKLVEESSPSGFGWIATGLFRDSLETLARDVSGPSGGCSRAFCSVPKSSWRDILQERLEWGDHLVEAWELRLPARELGI